MINLVQIKILRYGLVSIVGYLWVFVVFYFLGNRLSNIQSSVIAYGSWYGVQFLLQKNFIFNASNKHGLYTRYFLFLFTNYLLVLILHNIIFWLSSNVLFSILLTAILVFPIRYYVLNKWVYG